MDYLENVRRMREMYNMSQAELAKGICSQGLISKIEKKMISPDIEIMIKIAEKFNLTVSQLVGQTNSGDIYSHNKKEIKKLIDQRHYIKLRDYLEEINFATLDINLDFKLWVEAIVLYEVEGKYRNAIKLLNKAKRLNEFEDIEQIIRIKSALGTIYLDQKNYMKAIENFSEAFEIQKNREVDTTVKRKLLYNMALAYSEIEYINDSIFYARLAIETIIEADSLFLLDDSLLLLANNYTSLKSYEKAWDSITKAEAVAEIKGNANLLPYIEQSKNEIKLQSF